MGKFLPFLLIILFLAGISEHSKAEEGVFIDPFTGNDALVANLSEIECLALNIYHEARGESELGQMYVAQVSMNRMNHYSYGSTMCEVVKRHKQFSWTHDGKSDAVTDIEAWNKAINIAIDFYHLKKTVPDAYAKHYLWYYNPRWANPDWAEGKFVRKIGNHLFLHKKKITL